MRRSTDMSQYPFSCNLFAPLCIYLSICYRSTPLSTFAFLLCATKFEKVLGLINNKRLATRGCLFIRSDGITSAQGILSGCSTQRFDMRVKNRRGCDPDAPRSPKTFSSQREKSPLGIAGIGVHTPCRKHHVFLTEFLPNLQPPCIFTSTIPRSHITAASIITTCVHEDRDVHFRQNVESLSAQKICTWHERSSAPAIVIALTAEHRDLAFAKLHSEVDLRI